MSDSKQAKRGKYEDICEELLHRLKAESCIVLINRGIHGTGMSFSYREIADKPELLRKHAAMLDFIAAELRRQAGDVAEH